VPTAKAFITWRHALAGAAIAVAIPATIVFYRYWHRPLFANRFVQSELDPLPDWRTSQLSTKDGGTFLSDWRSNIAVVARPGGNADASEYIQILPEGDNVVLQWEGQTLKISRQARNQLFIMSQTGTDTFSIGDGRAKAIYESYWKGPDTFHDEVARLSK